MIFFQSRLIAIIDIGSNSIKTTVYLLKDSSYSIIYKDKYICNFIKGLSKNNNLSNQIIDKALRYLENLESKLQGFKLFAKLVIGTSALRIATNSNDFTKKAEKILKTKIDIISEAREAELAVKAVKLELGKVDGLVLDLGGGSLELAKVVKSEIKYLNSLQLGHQVLAEIAEGGISKLRNYIRKNLESIEYLSKFPNVYLCGGKFRRLAKLHMKLSLGSINEVKSYTLSKAKLKNLIVIKDRDGKTRSEGLLLYYSAILLDELLLKIDSDRFVFCGNSIREGLLAEF